MLFNGEHIWVGATGKIMIMIALSAAIISLIAYTISFFTKNRKYIFVNIGVYGLILHTASLTLAVSLLTYALYMGFYEYAYVWSHTSPALSGIMKFSALWAGKEGSLLLWVFCQAVFAVILILRLKAKHNGAVFFILVVQVFLVSLLSHFKLWSLFAGESPFLLLRELPVNQANDIFRNPDYLSLINKGAGLNPLLRNVWMIIHPPVLLAGYAAALIPWAIGMAYFSGVGGEISLDRARRWARLALIILGTGIMFGGAWAYVALSFGGFWTWDPVENASLVPWLVLLAAVHAVWPKNSNKMAGAFYVSAFILVVYAAFLTRSGVLGSVSVHSFGQGAVGQQLGAFVILLALMFLAAIFVKPVLRFFSKNSQRADNDTSVAKSSQKTWIIQLFVGITILSAFHIFFNTSVPVINYIFNTSLTLPPDTVGFYNRWQIVFLTAMLVLLLFAVLYWKAGSKLVASKLLLLSVIIGIIVGVVAWINAYVDKAGNMILLVIATSALVYMLIDAFVRRNIKTLPALMSHIGLLIFVCGIVLAFGVNHTIKNENSQGGGLIELSKGYNTLTNSGFFTFVDYDIKKDKVFYNIDYTSDKSTRALHLKPVLLHDNVHGDVFEPYVHKSCFGDLFVYVVKAGVNPFRSSGHHPDTVSAWFMVGDSLEFAGRKFILKAIETDATGPDVDIRNLVIEALVNVNYKAYDTLVRAAFVIKDGFLEYEDAGVLTPPATVRFQAISEHNPKIQLFIAASPEEHIIVKARYFPFINLVWVGLILIAAGLILSLFNKLFR